MAKRAQVAAKAKALGRPGEAGDDGPPRREPAPVAVAARLEERLRAEESDKQREGNDPGGGGPQGLTMRRASALPTACVRLSTFSLRSVFCTWFFTVSG